MTLDAWLAAAIADASARGLPQLKPLLESLAVATRALRQADIIDPADPPATPSPEQRTWPR
jgi:hypothetical protein